MRKSGFDNGYGDGRRRPRWAGSTSGAPAWRPWAAGVLAIAVLALLLAREPISDWLWPDTRIQQLRADAADALQAGELTRPDGRGARELYEAALALDPDRPEAREGLAQVGRAALARAETALARGRDAEAAGLLQLARELAVPRAQTDTLARKLNQRAGDAAMLDLLLVAADAARAAGRLDGGDDTALPLYQRILALRPNHTDALEGREDALADLLQRADEAMRGDDLARAGALVARVQAIDPGHVGLPDALAALARGAGQRLQKANLDLDAGRLQRALDGYRVVAAVQPGNDDAARGAVRVANAYAALSERHAADFRFVQARSALIEAQAIAPDARAVVEAEQHLARARQSQARLDSPLPPAQRARRLRELLEAAAAAEARGDLLAPPGGSAYDKLRAARAIAPEDPRVLAMGVRLLAAARSCFDRALQRNRLTSAGVCLEAWRLLGPDDPAYQAASRRLAQRWIAVGDERLGAGELQAARHALESARALDPGANGLDEFAERLRTAAAMID